MKIICVPQTFTVIQYAIDNASSGDKIKIDSNVYKENLVITVDCLTLYGDGDVILEGLGSTKPGATIDAHNVTLDNLTFQNFTTGIFSDGDKNIFNQVKSISNQNAGFNISGDHNIVSQCEIKSNKGTGAVISGNENSFVANYLEHNRDDGIRNGSGEFKENIIANNDFSRHEGYAINLNSVCSNRNIIYNNRIEDCSNGIFVNKGRYILALNVINDIDKIGILAQGNHSVVFKNTVIDTSNGVIVKANECFIGENVIGDTDNIAILVQGDRNYIRYNTANQFRGGGVMVNGSSNTLRCNNSLTTVFTQSATGRNNTYHDNHCQTLEPGIEPINLDDLTEEGYRGLLDLLYHNFD